MTNNQIGTQPLDAVVTAGGIPQPGEPLFEYAKGQPKALMDFAGKPMIQWVLDALSASSLIGRVVVVGLPPQTSFKSSHPLTVIESKGSILANLKGGVEELQRTGKISQKVLGVSSDVPAITGEMIDWLVNKVQETDHDLYYNVISREFMENKYPLSKRTYLKFKDMDICGGDVNAFDYRLVFQKQALFEGLFGTRKNPFKQASILGFDTLFLLYFKQLTLQMAETSISKKIGARGRAVVCPYPEMGMDVDKAYQFDQLVSTFPTRLETV